LPPAIRINLRRYADYEFEDAVEVETAHICAARQHIERWSGIAAFNQPTCVFNSCRVPCADRLPVRTASLAWTITGSFRRQAIIKEADVLPSRQPGTAAGPAIYSRCQNGAKERSVSAAIAPYGCFPTLIVSQERHHIYRLLQLVAFTESWSAILQCSNESLTEKGASGFC
jgi:hypothetical protein